MKHLGTKRIETSRLILRQFTGDDAQAMFDNWASDPEVTKFLTWPTHSSVDVTKQIVESWVAGYEQENFYLWMIELKEIGQPMHAFDGNFLRGNRIIVRRAKEGEKIVTLDEKEFTLNPENLVICDSEGPVALAGIMGGENSEIVEDTTKLTLESATFDATSIRKSTVRLAHRTDASARYEKSLDPEMTTQAIRRYVYLLENIEA